MPGLHLAEVGSAGFLTTVKVLVLLIFALQGSFIFYLNVLQQSADSQNQQLLTKQNTFDYIIVGAGTAGCLLANRLSANPETRVLLLEQGGDPNPLTKIPILSGSNQENGVPTIIYNYPTTPQKNACGATQGICSLMAAHALGGGSTINALAVTRGSPQIFDAWASLTGDERWSYENVLPFFKKSEDYHGYYQPMNTTYHGIGGELYLSNPDRQDPNQAQLKYFLNAAKFSGFPLIDVNNGEEARNGGSTHFDFNIKQGQRWGSYDAFLQPILTRPNVQVIRYALVTKIHLDNRRRATGVSFTKNGQQFEANARKEVVLSAGVFGSPKLLLLSGIGPSADLESVGISPRVELPVGKTFNDHVGVPLRYTINQTLFFYVGRDTQLSDIFQYVSTLSGNFPFLGNFSKVMSTFGGIFAKSSFAKKIRNSCPDIELTYGTQYRTVDPGVSPGTDAFQLISFLVGPRSVGNVKLRSSDPKDDLVINPNYLTAPEDMDRIVEALELNVNLVESSADFQALGAKTAPISACASLKFKSKAYWRCVARNLGGSGGQHYTGTCPMGIDSRTAVVDSQLRVFGVESLRVVDASVMPLIPNAHTASPTVMVAEVGAALILKETKGSFPEAAQLRLQRLRNSSPRRTQVPDLFFLGGNTHFHN